MMRILRSAEAMLNAPGVATRARIFCRSQRMATPLLNAGTLDELEGEYTQLMQTEPPTAKEEVDRQRKLQVYRSVLAAAYENFDMCVGSHALYGEQLPTNEQEREQAAQARKRIAEIGQELVLLK